MVGYGLRKISHTLFVALGVVTLAFAALRLSGEMAQRQKMLNERTAPPNSLLRRILHPTGFAGKNWVGSQPGHRFHDLMEQARIYTTTRSPGSSRSDYRLIVSEITLGR